MADKKKLLPYQLQLTLSSLPILGALIYVGVVARKIATWLLVLRTNEDKQRTLVLRTNEDKQRTLVLRTNEDKQRTLVLRTNKLLRAATMKRANEFFIEMQATPLWDRLPDEVVTVIRNSRTFFQVITANKLSPTKADTVMLQAVVHVARGWAEFDGNVSALDFQHVIIQRLMHGRHGESEMYARCMAAVWQERARCVRDGLVDTEE